jgi:diguanylate cyclase (GGDEF)-like protein
MLENNHMTGLLVYYFNKTYLAMIYKDYDLALDYVDQMHNYLSGGTGLIHTYLYYQLAALIRLKLYNSMDEVEQFQALKVVDASLGKLASVNTRINFKHRYLIVQAERSRVLNKHNEARAYYDAALSEVVSYRYTNDEALYREIISDYYAELNNAEMTKYYKQSSYQTYLKWGAKVKARLLLGESTFPSKVSMSPSIFTINAGSEIKEYGQIDLHSILKFSQIVAKEINIDELLKKTLYILLENAGATKASIVSYSKEGEIRVAVINSALSFELEKTRNLELLELPLKLINYVYHSKKIVRLGHANMDELFKSDNYIKSHAIQSILSYPLISQGDIIGIVILENDLANEAFSTERTEFLTLLSSQIAISLENATIYSQLEKIVDERTKDLKNKNEELELLNHKLKHISITDGLTGLFNRRRLDESLSYEYKKFLRYNELFSVILLDIDRFKLVNDVHGHLVGDVVLNKIADELVKITRAVDIVGRWGGEEFLVICPNTNNDEACNVAEKIRAAVEALNITNVGVVTCSIGVASITEGQQIKDVVSMADNHLYHSKEHGRNRVTC